MVNKKVITDIRSYWGGLIVVIGFVFLFEQFGVGMQMEYLWPAFILAPGVMFWYVYFTRGRGESGKEGLLIPGTILSLLGLFFFFEILTDWRMSGRTSFVYPLIVALAFFAAYRFGQRARSYLVPAWILAVVSVIVFFSTAVRFNAWPIFLICIGVWMIRRNRPASSSASSLAQDKRGKV